MKDLQDILAAHDRLPSSRAALATVVKTHGSSYRIPGARMLIREDGSTVGSISGGCLESDVIEKSWKLIETGEARLSVFDMTAPDDDLWGYGQGCNGVIHVLIEPFSRASTSRQLRFIRTCFEERRPGVMATVFRVEGEIKVPIGARLFTFPGGTTEEDLLLPSLTSALLEESEAALEESSSRVKEIRFTEGIIESFVEVIFPPIALIILGGGSDSVPLCRIGGELGWPVSVVDHRPAFAKTGRFPEGTRVHLCRPEEFLDNVRFDHRTAAVVMTHNFQHDLVYVKSLLQQNIPYVGLLGPRKRRDLIFQRLQETGFIPDSSRLAAFHNPVGLDIGGENPAEIALTIAAEIQAVLTSHRGGFLRNSAGPIHRMR